MADATLRAAIEAVGARAARKVADALQRSMLTRRLPEHPRLEIAAYYQPAVELMAVGGDWYDAFDLQDGRMALVVGDVVGRGIEAASAPGSSPLLYADGLVERRDRPIDRGLDELLAAVREHAAVPVAGLAERLPDVLVRSHASRDDVCLLAVSFGAHPPPAAKPG